jgi:aerobic carbon-monoxide dehydrogenase large subunit
VTDDDPQNHDQAQTWIGKSLRRVEDDRLLTGGGCFTGDVAPYDCLHVAFLRSPMPSGRLTVDVRDAKGPGVVAVFIGADTADIADLPVNPVIGGIFAPPVFCLAEDQVYAVGQPVAAVVATSRQLAQDAVEKIVVDYEDIENSETLFADCPDNQAFAQSWQDGDVTAAFADATVVSVRIDHPRLNAVALEPRTVVAQPGTDRLTVWLSTQTPYRSRADLADLLGKEKFEVRVITPDVGGAFGAKASLHPEEVFVAWAADKLRKPVKWVADRSEDFLAQSHGRGTSCAGQAAFSQDGKLLGLKAQIKGQLGHWLPFSAAVPSWNAARILPGPYGCEAVQIDMSASLSRTPAVNIYRGAGRPEAAMLMERLMDKAARELGLDPVDIRQTNLLSSDKLPCSRATGIRLDSGDYPMALKELTDLAGYPDLRKALEHRRAAGDLVGVGIALYIEPCGQGWETARVKILEDGTIEAATGSSAQGQGRETAVKQIVADELNVDPGDVRVFHGDTDKVTSGIGALASRSTAIGGSALVLAARQVKQQRLDTPEQTSFEADVRYEAEGEAWSYGGCLAVVSIYPDTGEVSVEKLDWVDDAGTVINPKLVKGQILGGIAQGLGEALMEKIVFDDEGQLLTGSLMDYALPRASDMPEITVNQLCTPSPVNLLGAKGVGEAGTIGAPAAVMNAILDALAPLGVVHVDMPATSETVWKAIKAAETGNTI